MENRDIAKMLTEMEERLSNQIIDSEKRTKRELMTYIESSVERDIKTIAEGVSTLVNRTPSVDDIAKDVEDLEIRLAGVEGASKIHRKELDELKKAQ